MVIIIRGQTVSHRVDVQRRDRQLRFKAVMKLFLEEVALVLSQIRLGLYGSQEESYHPRAEGM